MESDSAGHSTIFASFAFHRAPNTADPATVIRSTTCTGGSAGAIGSCGARRGGVVGATEAVGLVRLFSGISVSLFHRIAEYNQTHHPDARPPAIGLVGSMLTDCTRKLTLTENSRTGLSPRDPDRPLEHRGWLKEPPPRFFRNGDRLARDGPEQPKAAR